MSLTHQLKRHAMVKSKESTFIEYGIERDWGSERHSFSDLGVERQQVNAVGVYCLERPHA